MDPRLTRLADRYRTGRRGGIDVRALYRKVIARREKALLDSAALAAGLSALFYGDRVDMSEVTPQMEEAFRLAFPQKSLEELESMDAEQLAGIVSAWKGKYFEVIVRDELNAGEAVGDIRLEPGQTAELAESATQPGWDLVITDADGMIAQELSLKATDSLGYVREALERYPDIQVLTTEEVLAHPDAASDMILGSGIANDDLEQAVREPMAGLFDTAAEEALELLLPGLPFVLIAVGEGRHLLTGRRSFEQVLPSLLVRTAKTGTAMGAGVLGSYLLPDVFGILIAMGVRLVFSRQEAAERTAAGLERRRSALDKLAGRYVPN